MTHKLNPISRISELFSSNKTDVTYLSYKYEDIKPEWIIHEGNLEYLYGENILKSSLFKNYFIVLTCILNDKTENMIILYLYPNKTKSPYKYFQLDKDDQLNDRCRKVIVGKAGLFFLELIFKQKDKSEIFAARSVPERKLWIQKFDEAISKLKLKSITRSFSDAQSFPPKSTNKECSSSVQSRSINYVPFKGYDSNNHRQSNISLPNNLSGHQSYLEPTMTQPMKSINDYDEAKLILPTALDENEEISLWDEIFYNNDDFTSILNNIGQTGVFLIRSHSNDHDCTLCVYDNGHIYKFEIHQLSDHRCRLTYRENEPSFLDIPHLCQYYTNHPLHITLKDGFNKPIYLTFPYTDGNLYY